MPQITHFEKLSFCSGGNLYRNVSPSPAVLRFVNVREGNPGRKKRKNPEDIRLNQFNMRVTFMITSDTSSGVQLAGRGETPVFSRCMDFTMLVMMVILPA